MPQNTWIIYTLFVFGLLLVVIGGWNNEIPLLVAGALIFLGGFVWGVVKEIRAHGRGAWIKSLRGNFGHETHGIGFMRLMSGLVAAWLIVVFGPTYFKMISSTIVLTDTQWQLLSFLVALVVYHVISGFGISGPPSNTKK